MKNGEGLTDQDYARLHSASSSLAKMLIEVFACRSSRTQPLYPNAPRFR
jgi:hypothetical protein